MFIVFNKDKIKAYLISVGVVAVLFTMPLVIKNREVYETSATVNQIEEDRVNEEDVQNRTDKANEVKAENTIKINQSEN